ncbi:aminotransferase class I/II-fold pyridoxal phosphate-dependent enzyme [Anaeroglobus geminatus]|uniref:Aminotransferase n=1 Tax=Anaeroglobus geminatus F0357 TaxID=861450 RepID=G9YH60_9FIRM|nr:aminotransferase class I/II-fold pyridoxal phosphate-dependent enzyme [Anaeroglobus geminatus]EHM41115.1 threonine-phosphate decarboxylase domain protein [Anaeroglobus geminatus F0357]
MLRSLTKFYALPGLRLAFAAAAETVVARMEAHKDCWNVNILAQLAGAAALRDNEYARASIALIKREAAFLKRHLSAINGVRIFGGTVNFILIKLERMYGSATACVSFLEQEGILLRNCSNYEGLNDRFLRIAVKDRKTNEIVIKMIKKYFNNDKIR